MAKQSKKAEVNEQRASGERPETKEKKPQRVPVAGNRNVMSVIGKQGGYVYRWVNDEDNRIEKFKAAWYEFVDHPVQIGDVTINSADSSNGGIQSKKVGNGITAYLMRIKEEYYNEDQDTKQRDITAKEQAMKRKLNTHEDGAFGEVKIQDGGRPRSF